MNVDRHDFEMSLVNLLGLKAIASNPDAGSGSGVGNFWLDTSGRLHFKFTNGTDVLIQTSGASAGFAPVTVLTTAALPTNTYSSTTQQMTMSSTGSVTVNGVALAVGMRVAAFGEGNSNCGIYDVITAGATGVALVLQRSLDANDSAEWALGKLIPVSPQDTTNGGQSFYVSNSSAITVDTTTITVAQIVLGAAPIKTALAGAVKYYENDQMPVNALFAQTGSGAIGLSMQRVSLPYGINATQMDLLGALTVAASTHVSYTISAAVYTFNASSLSLASSATQAISVNSSVYTNYSGTRFRSIPLGTWALTPGEYMFALMASLNGPAGTTGSFSFFGQNSISINGVEGNASNYSAYFANGIYSAATGAFPASVGYGAINQTGSASTNNALAQPYFRLLAVSA